jgi:hypothetical protein
MKLNEFNVGDGRAVTVRHRHAVAGCHIRVRCVFKYAAKAAGREQNAARLHHYYGSRRFIERGYAHHFPVVQEQIGDRGKTLQAHVGERGRVVAESARDLATRGISVGVENAVAAMRAFTGKQQLRSLPVERGTPFDQLLNGDRSIFNQSSNGV